MQKLAALRAALVSWKLFKDNQLDTWASDIQARISGKMVGDTGLLAAEITYTAVIAIDRYSYSQNPVEQLIANLAMYLMTDPGRSELPNADPELDIVGLDDHTADIEVTLPFREQIYLEQSDTGPIQAGGKNWALQQPALLTAENLNGINASKGA